MNQDFIKIAKYFKSCFSNMSDSVLTNLLSAAFNGSRDDYMVFLDLLEEKDPLVKIKLQSDNLKQIFNELSYLFPQFVKSNLAGGSKFSFVKPFNNRLYEISIPLDKFYKLYYKDVIANLDITASFNSINIYFKSGQEPIINEVEVKSMYKRNGRITAFGHGAARINIDDDRAEKLISIYEDMAREDLNKLINIFII